ncbi:MAG: hypothetical protein KDE27_32200 [Planctomycetes bacterium]|nr:hypothetical protein [Planctomycetota bacterium]
MRLRSVVVDAATFPPSRLRTTSFVHPVLPPGFTVALQLAWLAPTGVALGAPCLVAAP